MVARRQEHNLFSEARNRWKNYRKDLRQEYLGPRRVALGELDQGLAPEDHQSFGSGLSTKENVLGCVNEIGIAAMAKKFTDIRKTFRLLSEEEDKTYRRKFLAAPPHWTHSDFIRYGVLGCEPPRTRKPRPVKDYQQLSKILGMLGPVGSNINQLSRKANMGSWPDSQAIDDACHHIKQIRDMLRRGLGYDEAPSD